MRHRYHGESNQINIRKEDMLQNERAIKAESKTRTNQLITVKIYRTKIL